MSDLIKTGKHFCILPWVHMSLGPSGQVNACCLADYSLPVGDLKKQSYEEIWNSRQLRKMRQNFLKDLPNKECEKCMQAESLGMSNYRLKNNRLYSHCFDEALLKTDPEGYLIDFQPRFLDLRFSNVCNFQCRTCGHYASNSWYEDALALGKSHGPKATVKLADYNPGAITSILKNLKSVEEIYFAGGEPLLNDEHFFVLEELIALGRTNTRLWYNTNFSVLNFKKWDVLELWSKFTDVRIQASLDGFGKRGEYLRHGMKWDKIVDNRNILRTKAPHIRFEVSSTVSCLNAWAQPDFYTHLLENQFIEDEAFYLNPVFNPPEFSVKALPLHLKHKVKDKYEKFLSEKTLPSYIQKLFENKIEFMFSEDLSSLLPKLKKDMDALDSRRSENLAKTFPELQGLFGEATSYCANSKSMVPPL